jgi:hypothetical protein
MATFTTITMVEPRHWLRAIQFLVTRRQRPFEHCMTGPLHARNYEVLKGMAAFEDAKLLVSVLPPA